MKRGTQRHRKTKRLAKALGIPSWAANGLLETLWLFAAEQAPTGSLGAWTDEEICEELGWSGLLGTLELPPLIATLLEVGFLDAHPTHRLLVHDWPEHADDAVHATLARAGKLFADGTEPRLTRLSKDERDKCAEKLAAARAARTAAAEAAPESAPAAHGERTASAQDARDGSLPCPALPPPTIPSAPRTASAADGDGELDIGTLLAAAKRAFPSMADEEAVCCYVWSQKNVGIPTDLDLRALDPIRRKVTLTQLATHLTFYLETVAPQFQSFPKFCSKIGNYAPKPKAVRPEHKRLREEDFAVMGGGA